MLAEIKYIPESLGEKFKGHVMIKPPLMRERMRYVKECNFKTNQEGSVEISVDNIDVLAKMIELAAPHITKVELEKDSYKYKSFEELEADSECQSIVMELAGKVFNGFTLGKN